jgi:enterochelin esterase-like enzyme
MRSLQTLTMVAILSCVVPVVSSPAGAQSASTSVGIFEGHSDVGTVLHAGSVEYDSSQRTYTISGSGENMWLAADAFQFVWKKMSGDVTLTADISFLTKTGNEHKKAVLMLRQTLDADSVYADVALHASGLTSLQFRDEKGAATREIQSNTSAPKRLRIAKRGDYVYMLLAADGEPQPAGGWLRIPLQGEFYVGLGVCSHDKDVVEKAVFSNLELTQPSTAANAKPILYSTLETIAIDSAERRVHYLAEGCFEAPNWMHDGSAFLFNRDGHIERLPVGSDKPVVIDTGFATRCNNDHGISPDATQIAISDNSQGDHQSLVYLVPITGGTPRRITQNSPSYWHGWSPDGKTLTFVGQRNGDFDIYTIPAAGGEETRLTTTKGLDDGPEYSPDGKYIYFNSERTGHMQIWRMKPDGSEQEQVFSDDLNNWFPHISPDGQWMVFLTYGADVTGHPENKDVMLRLMSLDPKSNEKKITVLAKLFGGQGTINVPSWSPDSKQIAFVSYMQVPDENTAAARPAPPTRDPNTPGYVTAKDLPDGANAPVTTDGNFILGATHNPVPQSSVHEGVPQGTVYNFTMNSADSKIYPGIARDPGILGTPDPTDPAKLVVTTSHPAPYTRRVAVYVPKQYVPGTIAPFIVGADGPDSLLFTVLDNLIAEHRVPVMIAISIGNGSGDAQGSERGLEYDTMSGRYAEFVEKEVLPQVEKELEKQANVKLTKDPDGRATMGGSSGGSCALIMAWYHPELYHRVLTYSGTDVNQQWPPNSQTPHGAWEFHEHLIPNTPAKPLRIWMEVGDKDLFNPNVMRDNMHDWVVANEDMARVLADKGYHYQFVFARNAGHVDRAVKQQTLPEALEYLWQGYPIAGPGK